MDALLRDYYCRCCPFSAPRDQHRRSAASAADREVSTAAMLVNPVDLTAVVGCRRTAEARAPPMRGPARLVSRVLYVSFPASELRDAAVEESNRSRTVATDGR